MNFDRQQLETFSILVETRHFGRSAQVLNVSRGAVSQRIMSLEEAFGTPLLVRDGVTPTPAGEMLLHHIQALKLLEADTLQRIKPDASSRPKAGTKSQPLMPPPAYRAIPATRATRWAGRWNMDRTFAVASDIARKMELADPRAVATNATTISRVARVVPPGRLWVSKTGTTCSGTVTLNPCSADIAVSGVA